MSVLKISEENFEEEVMKSEKPVILDFYADWCGPCKMLGPILEEISSDYKVVKINVDEHEDLARKYGIMSIPTVMIFKDGESKKTLVGFMPKEKLLSEIKEL